ncbi:MAG: GNAT family N-acetyltransferase [Saccharofermentans sp.]|nr:GNAT family N-acetyltransferase [Saccharofermentans sp.]
MVYELNEISNDVKSLFGGWEETLIYSCLQQVMGKVFVTDVHRPKSAFAYVGCFGFLVGIPDKELLMNIPAGFSILTPSSKEWEELIEKCYPEAKKITRYAIKKDTVFDRKHLEDIVKKLPTEYEIHLLDNQIYDMCVVEPQFSDFVSAFDSKEEFLSKGRGVVILKNGKIVSGASSYTRYQEGIEIEVDTLPEERRKHLAMVACAQLILNCLDEGLYPSWDAQNMNSVKLAEKLGYEFWHEYTAYEVNR